MRSPYICVYIHMFVTQSCLTLCNPMDCSPPGSSVHEIFQARILEWVAISFSRGSSQPRDRTQVSCTSCRFFYQLSYRGSPIYIYTHISSVQFSRSAMSDSLPTHESQHTRTPCPSPTPGVHSNSCPLSR